MQLYGAVGLVYLQLRGPGGHNRGTLATARAAGAHHLSTACVEWEIVWVSSDRAIC